MPDPAQAPVALGPEDYRQLHTMLTSSDEATRTQGQALAKKLHPDEQQAFFDVQQQLNKGKGETGRPDASAMGMPPELAVVTAAPVARAAAGAGLSLATRGVAAAKAAAMQASPFVKYEATKTLLSRMGVPEPLAVAAGMAISGYRKSAPAAAPTATEAPTVAGFDRYLPNTSTTTAAVTGHAVTPAEALQRAGSVATYGAGMPDLMQPGVMSHEAREALEGSAVPSAAENPFRPETVAAGRKQASRPGVPKPSAASTTPLGQAWDAQGQAGVKLSAAQMQMAATRIRKGENPLSVVQELAGATRGQ